MPTKLKKIVDRALSIREKAGYKTETITRKRYNMPYIPDAIKQAAKELKSAEKPKVKAKAKDLKSFRATFKNSFGSFNSVFVYVNPMKLSEFIVSTSIRKAKEDGTLAITKHEKTFPVSKYDAFVADLDKRAKAADAKIKKRKINTKQLARRAGQNTKTGVKVVKAGISEKLTSAIRAIIKDKKFDNLNYADAKLLYSLKKSAGKFDFKDLKFNYYDNFDRLINNDYMETINFTGKYKATILGAEFIKLVDQQIKNAKTDKFNPRLF
jgi:hypothetical protein